MTEIVTEHRVVFTALNGYVNQHDYARSRSAYEKLQGIRELYTIAGYTLEERTKENGVLSEVWTKLGCPNMIISRREVQKEYYYDELILGE